MANEENIQTPAAESAPIAEKPVVIQESSAVEPAKATTETAPIETKVDAAPVEVSLLADEPKPEATPEDGAEKPAKDGTAEKKEGETAEIPSEVSEIVVPTYEPFKIPENFKADDKLMGDFTKMLGDFEASKPDHVKFQEFGQKALEFHVAQLAEAMKNQAEYFTTLQNKKRGDDLDALRKDPVIGKNGDDEHFKKFGQDFINFIARHGGSKEEVTQFRKFTQERGVDNALPIVRLINNLKMKIEKYENESSKMLPGAKPAVNKPAPGKGILNAMYGGSRQ